MNKWPGFFVTFEGIEGSGKTTHARRLWRFLEGEGVTCLLTHEPGGTPLGEKLRNILLDPATGDIDGLTEALLFSASRCEHVQKVILPALYEGKVVICVRYTDSTIAYQGHGRGVSQSLLYLLNEVTTKAVYPDFTILLDVEPEQGVRRSLAATERGELRFEEEFVKKQGVLENIRAGYLEIAKNDSQRFLVISTTERSKEEVFEIIKSEIWRRLKERR